jgi:Tol biopolymer transport system component
VANADDRTTNNQLTSSLLNFSPQWSPDGQWITFVSNRDGNREIYVMSVTGAQDQPQPDCRERQRPGLAAPMQ